MSSHGHFLLIMIVIYQNVCVGYKNGSCKFFMSTSKVKVKGQRFRIQWASGYVKIYG